MVRTSVTHSFNSLCGTVLFLPHFWHHLTVIYYWTDAQQHGIYLIRRTWKKWTSAASLSMVFHYPDLVIHTCKLLNDLHLILFFQRSCFQGGILVWAQWGEEKNPNFFSLQSMLLKIWVLLLEYLPRLPVCVANDQTSPDLTIYGIL